MQQRGLHREPELPTAGRLLRHVDRTGHSPRLDHHRWRRRASDTLLLTLDSRQQQLYLPFRSTSPSTSFYIHYCQKALDYPELNDTLSFDYDAVPYFASEDCGAMYHYRVTRYTYTTHLIDSVGMTDSLITNIDRETIRIFFRTADPDNPDDND